MIVFVDYEHASGRAKPWGPNLLAARTWISYLLEDLSGHHCHLVRYDRITPELLDLLGAEAVFISGNSTGPDDYEPESLDALNTLIVDGGLPTFGFCGGFQAIAHALGVELGRVTFDEATEQLPQAHRSDDGVAREFGYHPVDLIADHPLLEGLAPAPIVRHSHSFEVPAPPPGFTTIASTPITEVQMAADDDRRIVGTQFHPEYFTDEHPAGRTMIENFLRWAGIA